MNQRENGGGRPDTPLPPRSRQKHLASPAPDGDETIEVTGPLAAGDLSFLQRVTVAGSGIALLPVLNIRPQLDQGHLVRVLPTHTTRGGALYLVSPASRHQLARVRLLREYLATNLPKLWSE